MKRFLIKVYEKDWTFKNTLKEDIIINNISYSLQKNWWQSDISLLLNLDYNTTSIIITDFVKIYLYDENFTNWKLVYTWIIEELNRNYKQSENTIELVCRWLASLLTRLFYNQSNYTFTKIDTASNIIKSIITYFNTIYSWSWLNTSWIVDTVWNITIDFDYTTCFDAMNDINNLVNTFWFIWSDWTVYFNNTATQHNLTAWLDIENLNINEDWSEIINKVIVKYNWWTYIWIDTTSITDNWLFEKLYNKTDLDLTWATAFSDEILLNNQIKQKVVLEINNKYIFENIKQWDKLKVRNLDYTINSTIEKITNSTSQAIVYLDKYDTIWKVLKTI